MENRRKRRRVMSVNKVVPIRLGRRRTVGQWFDPRRLLGLRRASVVNRTILRAYPKTTGPFGMGRVALRFSDRFKEHAVTTGEIVVNPRLLAPQCSVLATGSRSTRPDSAHTLLLSARSPVVQGLGPVLDAGTAAHRERVEPGEKRAVRNEEGAHGRSMKPVGPRPGSVSSIGRVLLWGRHNRMAIGDCRGNEFHQAECGWPFGSLA